MNPTPAAAEWCELDPKIMINQKHGKKVEGHVTYFGLTTPDNLKAMLSPAGVIDKNGDLFVSITPPDFPWRIEAIITIEKIEYAFLGLGTPNDPLQPGKAINFLVPLPD
jgi:hypothetical protein